jgi:hypothetical protein
MTNKQITKRLNYKRIESWADISTVMGEIQSSLCSMLEVIYSVVSHGQFINLEPQLNRHDQIQSKNLVQAHFCFS